MLNRFIQNPLTRKRLRRFRARRRAYWSLIILGAAYALSLGSELICNDRPLFMRCEGRWYAPVFRYYPEDTFLHNGKQTRPNYRALRQSPQFRDNPRNFMRMPPIPFGPYESIDPASLQAEATINVTLTPIPRVGNVNVDVNLKVVQALACGYFFRTNDLAVSGADLAQHWPITESLRQAITQRLHNQSAPAIQETLAHHLDAEQSATISIPAYAPRPHAPPSVRLTFRDIERHGATASLRFAPDGTPQTSNLPSLWSNLSETEQARITNLVIRAAGEYVPASELTIAGTAHRLTVQRRDVTWPHEPVRGHWMGIDNAGRDVLARIIYGFRISMSFGFLLVVATMVLGVVIGGIQGYLGGRTDMFTQRLIEIWSALPFLYVMILLGSIYGRSFSLLLVCYGIFNWIGISYYMRAEFLRLRRQSYVEAARCLGVPNWRIMLEHILPNALTPLITFFPFSLVGAISALYGLDYLGFGLPPPTPSWGEMLHQAQQFRWAWWLILYPAAAIFFVMLLGVFVGEGIRDAFDPKPISRME